MDAAATVEGQVPDADSTADGHMPASELSQDISHVLKIHFKDTYCKHIIGEDTMADLVKTAGDTLQKNTFHSKYVEELQQAFAEYKQCVQEADTLESHIIEARNHAEDIESRVREKMKQGGFNEEKSIITVQSMFPQCVDEDLLEMNNLISPWAYLSAPKLKQFMEAPEKEKQDPTKPTVSYSMHNSREPQDDGYTFLPIASSSSLQSEVSITVDPSSDGEKRMKIPCVKTKIVKPKPKWKGEPSAPDRTEGKEKLRQMKDRQNFLRNPRFLPPNPHRGSPWNRDTQPFQDGTRKSGDDLPQVFRANPPVLFFTGYTIGQVYETTLELKNITSACRHVRVIPPTTTYFSIGLGRFPGEGGMVAPGMSCKYSVRFAPDSLSDFQDFIVVESQSENLVVLIEARRPPPMLTLPKVLDCGHCLIGGVKFVEFMCQNVGLSSGTFCIIPKHQWPASNLRSVAKTLFTEQPPFAVSPTLFALQPGETTVVEVVFFPSRVERACQLFTIVCDNCQVKDICVQGEGHLVALELTSVSGNLDSPNLGGRHDLAAEHFPCFGPCNPHARQEKTIIVRNNVHVELPFHWRVMKPNLPPSPLAKHAELPPTEYYLDPEEPFHVSPEYGLLDACQDHEFVITFCPKELKDYHSVCHLVLMDIPLPPSDIPDISAPPVASASSVSDVIGLEIEVKGSTEPYKVLLEPYGVIIPGELLICTTTRRQFKMWNHSRTSISFQWERMDSGVHIIEVLPPCGQIEKNECLDFDLIVNGGKPDKVVTSLICHVEHHYEPVTLPVEVSFKGPTVTISAPNIDFGLLRLGDQRQIILHLMNTSQLEASWALGEKPSHQKEPHEAQISVKPCRGVLPPLGSGIVDVVFNPSFCQQLQTELELTVENGSGCHLLVEANVQCPQVCLLDCQLLLSGLYVGVSTDAMVTLFNQTLFASIFRWMPQLQGNQASLCEATFEPTCGTLGPNASLDVTIKFTSHADCELTEVVALCEIEDVKSPLILRIRAEKAQTLAVSYSLDKASCPSQNSSVLLLDFGGDVLLKKSTTRRFKITNETAIPAPFSIVPEYFYGNAPDSNYQSQKSSAYVKRPLHHSQAKKVEEKMHMDFVSSLLANGKGAVFTVSPDSGMLGAFQTQAVDVTAHTDMWGEYTDDLICKVGDLEPTLIPMQMTVRGCPLYFQMTGPREDGQNEGPVIWFGTHVSGGDTVSRSLRINNPTVFDIRLDWRTYNIDADDKKLVDLMVSYGEAFPVVDMDSSVRPKPWERAQTPDSAETAGSSIQSLSDAKEEECIDEEDSEREPACSHPYHAEKSIVSVRIRPHEGNLSDYPYCITPQQIVVPAKGSSTIHLSFTPLTLSGESESKCVGKALGFLSLDSKGAICVPGKVGRTHGLELEPVRMNLQAVVKPAKLSVQMDEDEEVLEFRASASDLVTQDAETQLLQIREFDITKALKLYNTLETPLQFALKTQPPFSVLLLPPKSRPGPCSKPSTGDGNYLLLQPQRSMMVKVAFRCSFSLVDFVDLADDKMPDSVKLIQNSKGEWKLRFKQMLQIHFSNGSTQTIPLCAHLEMATLSLSSESVDFGSCYVGKTQMTELKLFNTGAKTHWDSVIESGRGDSSVFQVTPESGLFSSKDTSHPCFCQCLQIKFTASEDREFKARVVLRSPLVKTPLVIHLQGTGTYNEGCSSGQP